MDLSSVNVPQVIEACGSLFSMLIAIIALLRSSRQKGDDQLKEINKSLNEHILEDTKVQAIIVTKLDNLIEKVKNDN